MRVQGSTRRIGPTGRSESAVRRLGHDRTALAALVETLALQAVLAGRADTVASTVLSLVLSVNQERHETDGRPSRRQSSAQLGFVGRLNWLS